MSNCLDLEEDQCRQQVLIIVSIKYCLLQIYLLAAPPSKLVTAIFRLQLHMLTGAPIAILFPVINTRLVSFSKISNTFLFLFYKNNNRVVYQGWIFFFKKMLVRKANEKTLIRSFLQKQSDLGLTICPVCLGLIAVFFSNFRTLTICIFLCFFFTYTQILPDFPPPS